jgi:uracil-DNA glycosylase
MPSAPAFDPGYVHEPFKTLAGTYPGDASDEYSGSHFRTEWGPIFHRGRLDGTARVLAIGQDPGQHENILRRILVGKAGRRVQGFLAKLGITTSYVLINTFAYSVYGNDSGPYVTKPKITAYRNAWIDGILAPGQIQAVITFGSMAKTAWAHYAPSNPGVAGLRVVNLKHPTYPESAGGTPAQVAAHTKAMLEEWNAKGLEVLFGAVAQDVAVASLVPYGDAFTDADQADIPSADLPAGIPAWMYEGDGWASRVGATALATRANITITVPPNVLGH